MKTSQQQKPTTGNVISFKDLFDFGIHFYDESVFQEMLWLERKRSERSGKPFLLMLIDTSNLMQDNNGKLLLRKLVTQINQYTRETDIKGWHTEKRVVGIIFNELGNHDGSFILEKITRRIKNCLFYIMEAKYFSEIEISLQWFPVDLNQPKSVYEPNTVFYPDLFEKQAQKRLSLFLKRLMDITGALTGLLLFLPLFIIIPFLIKISSKGPILYKQERVGQFGKKFSLLKFRSMFINNDETIHRNYIKDFISNQDSGGNNSTRETPENKTVFKLTEDNRITPVGNILRKTSLDELPQFINVLKGDMSLVGPRPPIPYEYEEYKIWHMKRVIEIKPGITGLWQVNGRSSCNFDEMVRLDLKYMREWSLWLDIKIILKTPLAVLTGKGAY